jgi:hypothetical protein
MPQLLRSQASFQRMVTEVTRNDLHFGPTVFLSLAQICLGKAVVSQASAQDSGCGVVCGVFVACGKHLRLFHQGQNEKDREAVNQLREKYVERSISFRHVTYVELATNSSIGTMEPSQICSQFGTHSDPAPFQS